MIVFSSFRLLSPSNPVHDHVSCTFHICFNIVSPYKPRYSSFPLDIYVKLTTSSLTHMTGCHNIHALLHYLSYLSSLYSYRLTNLNFICYCVYIFISRQLVWIPVYYYLLLSIAKHRCQPYSISVYCY
jgi:hypothetical protein